MARTSLSRPFALALRDQLITPDTTVLDYGCGRGRDLELLTRLGIPAVGWDPAHRPDQERRPCAIVNLGFVINVIEKLPERAAALRDAYTLTTRLLIVAARLIHEQPANHIKHHGDGIVTRTGTFQKFYTQTELRDWIDGTLNVSCIASAPGIFYVFTEEHDAQTFLSKRYLQASRTPSIDVSKRLFAQHGDTLKSLIAFYASHGRLPAPEEYDRDIGPVIERFGSLRRAFRIVTQSTPAEEWDWARLKRQRDLLVFGALAAFDRQVRFSDFPLDVRHDIRALFGSFKSLRRKAQPLLFAAGDPESRHVAFEAAATGKLTANALYIHTSALGDLPPLLRIYEGCARQLVGDVPDANIIKLHRHKAAVSYLAYPRFDRDAHPALHQSLFVDLTKLDFRQQVYHHSPNPPILHRKETFVTTDYRLYQCFARLTRQEDRLDLLTTDNPIGNRNQWDVVLHDAGVTLRGHRVVRR
jgi:DNA phosphorothioation-associated putative methyltransferase